MNGTARGFAYLLTVLALLLVTTPPPIPLPHADSSAPHQCPGGIAHPLM